MEKGTDFHLQIFQLDFVADNTVGLCDIFGIYLVAYIFGIENFGI